MLLTWTTIIFSGNAQTPAMSADHYPYPTKKIHLADGVEVSYIDEGSGAVTLLLIHGLGSYLPAWKKTVEALKNDFRCVALDLPGFGRSPQVEDHYSMSFYAEVIRNLIAELELDRVVLAGHSMGGQIALTTVLDTDTPVEKLILLAPAGFETFSEEKKAWFRQYVTPEILAALPDEQIERNFAVNFYGNRLPADAGFMYEDRLKLKADKDRYEAYCRLIPGCVQGMLEEPVFERLPQVDIPVLVLYGEDDLLIPNRLLHPGLTVQTVAHTGTEQLPNARLEMIPKAGHFLYWDQPERVHEYVREFIHDN